MSIKIIDFNEDELNKFKQFQQRSYQTLLDIKEQLKIGMTEIQVARMIRKSFHQQGVHSYFHVPVALFGERTGYPGNFGQFEALATDKKLEQDMAIILDAAPIYEGYIVDTSLATSFGNNPQQLKLHRQLESYRDELLQMVKARQSFSDIELRMNEKIIASGAQNCHRKHIGEVIGHRIFRETRSMWNKLTYKQLSIKHVAWLFWKSIATKKGWINESPNWNHRRTSAHPPFEGLWAVEPHFAINGIGVKFEEIMVITKDDAYWLDDDLPHTRLWSES